MEKRFEFKVREDFESVYAKSDTLLGIKKVQVSDLTRSEAEEYAKLMHDTFIKHWEEKHNTVTRKEK